MTNVVAGKNSLRTMIKDMCSEAHILGKTNHSPTSQWCNYSFVHVPEKVIQKVTGHRSLEALRTYENISTDQHKEVSKVLMSNLKSSQSWCQTNVWVLGGINGCSIGNITVNFPSE